MATAVQGSFVGRTKSFERLNVFETSYQVVASTTYEPTGSFQNTGFYVEAGSNYTCSMVNGGSDIQVGLVTGQVYNIALKKVITGAGTTVRLLK
tara:strand:- start:332 stop:613 length:282 start_codon:yes stop_codon:yes gene_type:complete